MPARRADEIAGTRLRGQLGVAGVHRRHHRAEAAPPGLHRPGRLTRRCSIPTLDDRAKCRRRRHSRGGGRHALKAHAVESYASSNQRQSAGAICRSGREKATEMNPRGAAATFRHLIDDPRCSARDDGARALAGRVSNQRCSVLAALQALDRLGRFHAAWSGVWKRLCAPSIEVNSRKRSRRAVVSPPMQVTQLD